MGWEERSGRWYYYGKERTPGGRVVSRYRGRDELARLIEQVTRGRRLEREAERARFDTAKAAHRKQRQQVDNVQRAMRAIERAVLITNGYRTHKGQWRKRREHEEEQQD